MGLAFGALWERLFSDFWTYNPHAFAFFVTANLPGAILAGWIAFLLGGLALSERLVTCLERRLPAGDGPWRDVPWDVCAFALLGITMETFGLRLGLWRYDGGLTLGLVPGLGISVFVALACISFGSLVPTSVRFWRRHLTLPRPALQRRRQDAS